ncbi:glycosyltransferase family 9 protein [soil metagenome]
MRGARNGGVPVLGDLLAVSRGRPPVLLVLRALGLGDFLTAVPAFRGLAEAFPEHRRLIAAPPALRSLVSLLGGALHGLTATEQLQPVPCPGPVDVGVNLHGKGPASHRALLACAPRRLVAFEHPAVPASRGMPRHQEGENEVLRWCRLLNQAGIPSDPTRLGIASPESPVRPDAEGATIIHAGAASQARRWPPARWAEVARRERREGRVVLLTGSQKERSLATSVARLAGLEDDAVCAGGIDLLGLAALVSKAGRVVCGDTGVAHLATALRTPSVILFGPMSPAIWGPPPERPEHIVLWAGRSGDPHASRTDRGLLAIGVDDVSAALHRLDRCSPAGGKERCA